MTRAEMRSMFLLSLGLQSGDLTDADVDNYLNRVWQRSIPNRVSETCDHGYVEFSLVVGTDEYSYLTMQGQDLIRSVMGPILLSDGTELEIYTDPTQFHRVFTTATDGKPTSVLVYGRKLTFRPVPVAVDTVKVYCHLYRSEFTSSGISDDAEAMCVVHGAVMYKASDTGMDDLVARYDELFRSGLAEVAAKYGSGVRKSRPPGDIW